MAMTSGAAEPFAPKREGSAGFVVKLRFAMVPAGGTPSDTRETAYLATIESSAIRLLAPQNGVLSSEA